MSNNTQTISWKTTVCGIITAVGAYFAQSGIPNLELIGQFLVPLGGLCTGVFAKDS